MKEPVSVEPLCSLSTEGFSVGEAYDRVIRSPLYSALDSEFVTHLRAMTDETCRFFPFETIEAYYTLMNDFIATSVPALHPFWWSGNGEQ